jgi:hypothetical protein
VIPRIDVHTFYRRAEGRRVCALVTSGMSDLEMDAPDDGIRRAELIFYCDEPKQEYIDTIRWLARFPHSQKTWIGYFTTIPNGNPPEPIWDGPALDTIIFLPPIVVRDQALPKELVLQGEPVHFLWLVPISTAECNLKLAKGSEALLDIFEQRRHPHVFDPMRKSYI